MYPYYYRLLSGKPCPSLNDRMLSGYNDRSSNANERRPDTDTDRPTLVGAWVQGRYYMGEPGGDAGEYLSAEATLAIEHLR